jgi:hypothetical protein
MTDHKTKICPEHKMPMKQKWNSTVFVCPRCLIEKNNRLLAQSHLRTSKKAEKGLKGQKTKRKNFSIYTTTAWKWFSRYVLLFYADKNNVAICATSGRRMTINTKNCHCGHYVKVMDMTKTNYATAFDFKNVGPQSAQDNRYGGGRMDLMRDWLVEQHGKEAIEELEIKKNQICYLDKVTLDQIAEEYKAKFKELLIERNIEDPWK